MASTLAESPINTVNPRITPDLEFDPAAFFDYETETVLAAEEIGEHTSELQSRITIAYSVFCLKKKKKKIKKYKYKKSDKE